MERRKKMFESMLGERNEKEKEGLMETCLSFLKGQASDNDREREEKNKEEAARPPDRSRFAGCCPETMERFFEKMQECFAEKGKDEKEGKEGKTERTACCSG
ncbi:MAG TPA: hypothetical protein VFU42_09780 [Candidatus Deferrimicrobiaceae bacterium]|nr:hypothetical protein [Candidatus Deferrimicrobiaceae bacterium]